MRPSCVHRSLRASPWPRHARRAYASRAVHTAGASASPPAGSILEPESSVEVDIDALAELPVTRVSLTDLFQVCKNPTPQQLYLNAQFLRKEVPVRYAHRVRQLRHLPYGLSQDERIVEAADLFTQLATAIMRHPKPSTPERRKSFDWLLQDVTARTRVVPQLISLALEHLVRPEYQAARLQAVARFTQQREIDRNLDAFFTARIGQRFLVMHYLAAAAAATEPREGFSGIIQSRCSPVEVCESAAAEVERIFKQTYGRCAAISILGDRRHTFTYVPSHIFFVLAETLKNACKATMRGRPAEAELPPVRVIVACGEKDVMIKIEDEGGGIPRSRLADVWSYCSPGRADDADWMEHSTSLSPLIASTALEAPPASRGMGLPQARLYAKYFGGSLHLIPMEGYGTDCYVKFNRLGDDNCENIPQIVSESPGQKGSAWDKNQINPFLFDAQARR